MIITIDGVSSTGKSTLAKGIADRLNLIYIDTGAMYRAATLLAIENGLVTKDIIDDKRLIPLLEKCTIEFKTENDARFTILNGINVEHKIRTIEISDKVSLVSKIAKVREILVEKQRQMGLSSNVILDGRDTGTVVFPNADVKFFITASAEVRAKRRFLEYQQSNSNITLEQVKENIEKRDYMDKNRDVSPLVQAPDAILLDNSYLSCEEQLDIALKYISSYDDAKKN